MNNAENSPQEEELTIDDLIAEQLDTDAPPIPASAERGAQDLSKRYGDDVNAEIAQNKRVTTEEIKAITDKREKVEEHETYGMTDEDLKKPYSTLDKTPEGMHIKSGNEQGAASFTTEKANLAGFTDQGVNKEKNDDGMLVSGDHLTAAVTDGVGGNAHGEVASNVTLHTLAAMLDTDPEFNLKDAPTLANGALHEYHDYNAPEYAKCSTTFAAVQITPEGLAKCVHIGDAKIIMIRDGEIHYESVDDNLLELIKANQGVDDKAALDFIYKKYSKDARPDGLVQSIGRKEQIVSKKTDKGNVFTSKTLINPHYKEFQTQPGDVFLVMTDGLRHLDADEMRQRVVDGLKEGKAANVILDKMRVEAKKRMEVFDREADNLSGGIIEIK
ncbi:PP2C family protein-serine/threonine phosphatase [Patescibacteria group bacterium]